MKEGTWFLVLDIAPLLLRKELKEYCCEMKLNAKVEGYEMNVEASLRGIILLVAFKMFITKIWKVSFNTKIQLFNEKMNYKEVVKCY